MMTTSGISMGIQYIDGNMFEIIEWYSGAVSKALADSIALDDIEILTSFQAKRIVELYNYLASEKGPDVIGNGWKSAGITGAIEAGLVNL